MHKVLAGSKQHLAAVAYTQNKAPGSIKFQIEPSQAALKPILWPWCSGPSGTHSSKSYGPEFENLLWKSHISNIFGLLKKFQGSVIFWTLLSKNCLLFNNFNKQLILVKFIKGNNKSGPKFSLELMFAQLLLLQVRILTKTSCLSKLSKNRQSVLSKVQKMTESWIFS